jgi:hypothetical protein
MMIWNDEALAGRISVTTDEVQAQAVQILAPNIDLCRLVPGKATVARVRKSEMAARIVRQPKKRAGGSVEVLEVRAGHGVAMIDANAR